MGVQARVVLYAPTEGDAREAARAAFARIAALDAALSDYRPSSELMQLSARSPTGPVPVSGDLFGALALADTLARRSGGAFDATAGPVVRLWREARRTGTLPSPDSLRAARARVGFEKLRLHPGTQQAALDRPGMQLDLGGLAKGLAADEALAVLEARGLGRALVELGGDLRVGRPPPGEPGWRVEVAHAEPGFDRLVLSDAAVSSSGDTEQFLEWEGVRYSHVVDPRTGQALTRRTSATVVASRAALSDALATVLTVLGPDAGRDFLGRYYPDARASIRLVSD